MAGGTTFYRFIRTLLFGASSFTFAFAGQNAYAQAAEQWRDANHIFEKTCGLCHLVGVGPNLFGRNLSPEYTIHTVKHGKNGMPAFRPTDFSNAELLALGKMIQESSNPTPAGVSK